MFCLGHWTTNSYDKIIGVSDVFNSNVVWVHKIDTMCLALLTSEGVIFLFIILRYPFQPFL